MLAVLTIVQALQCAAAMFFHEPSSVVIEGLDDVNNSDFGFAMAYMKESKTLVVGAPRADFIGKVFKCEMEDVMEKRKISCGEQLFDYLPSEYDTEKFPKQHFLLGASISTANHYFFTCAPLWTTSIDAILEEGKPKVKVTDTYGTCFMQNNETNHRYQGLLEIYQNHNAKKTDLLPVKRLASGTGWTTLIDEENDLILIAKTSGEGDFVYAPSSKPLSDVQSLVNQPTYTHYLPRFFNIGFGITPGKFFTNQTVYAFSMLQENMEGIVQFLAYQKKNFWLYMLAVSRAEGRSQNFIRLESKAVGTMFGTTMSAADLNMDGLDELLVGAPAQAGYECYECGALHIYIGGDMKTIKERKRLRSIFGISEFGRFGTGIAVKDIDGDDKSELVVSAPYENQGRGVIYILSGYEVYYTLMKSQDYKSIQLSDLKLTQKIEKESSRALGFSLQFIDDVDVNGCDELAASSPGASKVLLFKCVKKITVTLTSQLIGEQIVREQDSNFTVQVCARVELPSLPADIIGNITIQNSIIGEAAIVTQPDLVIDISCFGCLNDSIDHCKNVTVELTDKEPRDYTFKSKAQLQNKYLSDLNMTDFNNTWVEASPYSKLDTSIEVFRHCKGDDCTPQLSLELQWTGSKSYLMGFSANETERYLMGSSANETVRIKIHNAGNASYSACVWFLMIGAQLGQAKCEEYRRGFRCKDNLPIPLKRDTDTYIDLVLDMTEPTNTEENLIMRAYLYENCNQENVNSSKALRIDFDLTSENISYDGDNHKLNITDKQILDNAMIIDHQEYPIRNYGKITWKQIEFSIAMLKKSYINSFKISAGDAGECKDDILVNSSLIIYHCTLDLPPNTTKTIIGTTEIIAGHLNNYAHGAELNISSESQLHLSRVPALPATSITTITIQKEITLGRNKWLITVIAVIVALIILVIVTIILYKCGFFRRKQKQKLLVMRESERRKSVRRNTHVSAMDGPMEGLQMDVDDDSPFGEARPVTTKDNVGLVNDDDL